MTEVEKMLQDVTKPTGPYGGNLHNPAQQPDARRAPLTAGVDPATGLPGLHSSKSPNFRDTAITGRVNEPPWARLGAFMLLAGRTNTEIAAAAGVTPGAVSQIRAQRWFQELLTTLANEQGEEVIGLLRAEAVASIEKIREIRDNDEAGAKANLAAAVWLAEQSTGKAVQKVQSVNVNRSYSSPEEEFADIQRQLADLRAARARTVDEVAPTLPPPVSPAPQS